MLKWMIGALDRICVVVGALVFAQAPVFMQQYIHRLGGHVSELQYQMKAVLAAAEESEKTLPEYMQKFLSNTDPDVIRQGTMMQGMVERLDDFSHSLVVLNHSTILQKPFLFVYHLKSSVFVNTLSSFEAGVSFTAEAAVYAFIGMGIGYFIFLTIRKMLVKTASVFRYTIKERE